MTWVLDQVTVSAALPPDRPACMPIVIHRQNCYNFITDIGLLYYLLLGKEFNLFEASYAYRPFVMLLLLEASACILMTEPPICIDAYPGWATYASDRFRRASPLVPYRLTSLRMEAMILYGTAD